MYDNPGVIGSIFLETVIVVYSPASLMFTLTSLLSITMFISYRTRSTVMASTVAFLLILIPDWLTNYISSSNLITFVKLFPDQLLNSMAQLSGFTFLDIQGIVISPLAIMMVVYFILACIFLISIYLLSRKEYLQ